MMMPFFPAMRIIAVFFAVLALGATALGRCQRDRDPLRIHIRDFDSEAALSDTLRKLIPPGMRVSGAWEMMQSNGFKCGERAATTIDAKAGKLGSGPPYLQCWQSSPIYLGLKHRDWTVTFHYDSSGVRDLRASYIIQP